MIVYYNGSFVNKKDLRISPFNDAFLYGKGIFETFRTFNYKPFRIDDHIHRLNNSLNFFGYKKVDSDIIKNIVDELSKINKIESAIIRITVSKNLYNEENILLIDFDLYKPTIPVPAKITIYSEKQSHISEIRKHKTTNYLLNKFVYETNKLKGFEETIFIDHYDHILEGTRTNIFFVKEETLYTPSFECGILPGITRKIVLEIAKELGVRCEERVINFNEIKNYREVFLTNSINGIIKVKSIDDYGLKNFHFSDKFSMIYKQKLYNL